MYRQFQVDMLIKWLPFVIFNVRKAAFDNILGNFGIFTFSSFYPDLGGSKNVNAHFRVLSESWQDMYYTIHAQNVHFDLFGLVTSDGPDLTWGYQGHMGVIRCILGMIHAVPSALFPFDTATWRRGASNDG